MATATLAKTLRHFDNMGEPVTATVTAATVTATQGTTTVLDAVTATITPTGAATSHVLSYAGVPLGTYNLVLGWTEDGEARTATVVGFVVGALYQGVYGYMETRLWDAFQDAKSENPLGLLADADLLEREVGSVVRDIFRRTSAEAGFTYSDLTADDKEIFDEAAALRACARLLHPTTTGGGAATDIVLDKSAEATTQYAQISNATVATERDRWNLEADRLERSLSWYKAALAAATAEYTLAGVAGRRRAILGGGLGFYGRGW